MAHRAAPPHLFFKRAAIGSKVQKKMASDGDEMSCGSPILARQDRGPGARRQRSVVDGVTVVDLEIVCSLALLQLFWKSFCLLVLFAVLFAGVSVAITLPHLASIAHASQPPFAWCARGDTRSVASHAAAAVSGASLLAKAEHQSHLSSWLAVQSPHQTH